MLGCPQNQIRWGSPPTAGIQRRTFYFFVYLQSFFQKKIKNKMFSPRPPARSRLMDFCWYYGSYIFANVFLGHSEHCFFTNWARFGFQTMKIPPFEPQFHAEFENEGPRASFFHSDVVFVYLFMKKQCSECPKKHLKRYMSHNINRNPSAEIGRGGGDKHLFFIFVLKQ